jgi:hypothetical protein
VAADREGGTTTRVDHAPQQAAESNAAVATTSTAAVSAVAGAVSGGPSKVAAVLRRFPGQRAAIMAWLQSNCGNAFAQSVLAESDPVDSATTWDIVATPHSVQFPETEVGAVSAPRTITLINRGHVALELASLDLVMYGGTGEAAQPGEFELIQGQARSLGPLETMAVQVVFRPTRALPHIGAHVRGKGPAPHQQVEVALRAASAAPRAEHADQRELSVAEHEARGLEVAAPSSVEHYGDMLAAVLAARTLTNRAKPGDPANPQIAKLLDPVAKRLNELNDHHGRFAEFGAGNIAGQAAIDMSESAIRRWLQLAALGGMIHPDDLVTKFRVGAEPIRFLTGERGDAPTLRGFDHASRAVAVGSAALALSPALVALAAEEAALIGFAAQMGTRQVAVWALANPAAALAASEALIGFGVQIGEDGIDTFWDQLHDPQGCWFVFAQVLMDFMHVKTSMSVHGGEPAGRRAPAVDLDAARERTARVRTIVQQVHDAAASGTRVGAAAPATGGDSHAPAPTDLPAVAGHAPRSTTSREKAALEAPSGAGRSAAQHEAEAHEISPSKPSVAHAADADLRSQLPSDLHGISVVRSAALAGTDVVVQYRNGEVHIEAGPLATGRHVGYHVATARQLLRFKGPLGLARRLVDTARSKLRGTPGYGTAGFEARAEVAKLVEIERELVALRGRLEEGAHVVERGRALDTGAVDAELARVQEQLELEGTRLDSYEPGKGFVAARALPVYPISLDSIEANPIETDPRQFEVEFTARTKEGTVVRLGQGTVQLTPEGEPKGYPEFNLNNYTHFEGTEHKVKLYQSVLDQGASAIPLGQGEETALTRYAIDKFIQRYKARFHAEPAALGGTLAYENKKNFQVQFVKYLNEGMGAPAALRSAAAKISYGTHRAAADYGDFEVDAGDPKQWVLLDLGDGNSPRRVPTTIKIIAKKNAPTNH